MVSTTSTSYWSICVGGLVILVACTVGCQVVGGFEDFSASTRETVDSGGGGGGDSSLADLGVGHDGGGDEGGGEQDVTQEQSGPCPSEKDPGKAGPKMAQIVRADGKCFWIDKTEVTVGHYQVFLDSNPPAMTAYCEWNTSFAASCEAVDGGTDAAAADARLPVTCVDWCDAKAYCEWAGKTLCVGSWTAAGDPSQSYWYAACAGKDLSTFPYGDNYDHTVCNGSDRPENGCPDSCSALPADEQTACATREGVLNLSGNAGEWVDECGNTSGEKDECHVRGGTFRLSNSNLACGATFRSPRNKRADHVGFRCCADDVM